MLWSLFTAILSDFRHKKAYFLKNKGMIQFRKRSSILNKNAKFVAKFVAKIVATFSG
jgi:hypothetical protein